MAEFPDYLRSPTCWLLFLASLMVTASLTPLVMRFARRVGAVDSGGYRKIYAGSMPMLGGLGILVPVIGVCLMGMLSLTGMFGHIEGMKPQFLVLCIGSIAIAGLGVFDDIRGLRARYKLLIQILIALFVVSSGELMESIRLPLFGEVEIGSAGGMVLGVVWIVGLINALNIIDGVDGLAASVALIATLGLLALGAIDQLSFVVLVCSALVGSVLGFLPYNFYPARIFLGDTGSMLLGFVLAAITLMSTYRSATAVIVVAPLLVLGFPIFETLLSMARRLIRGAPIFGADDRHTHHRLLSRGYSQRKVVLLLCGVSGILTATAILSRVVPFPRWEWFSLAVLAVTLVGMGWLAGYMRTIPVERVVRMRQRNAVYHAFARYAALSLSAEKGRAAVEEILGLGRLEFGLSYLAVGSPGRPGWIVAAGSAAAEGPRDQMRVQSALGNELLVDYQFEAPPDDETKRDVAASLARLFEQTELVPAGRGDRLSSPPRREAGPHDEAPPASGRGVAPSLRSGSEGPVSRATRWIDGRFYPAYSDNWDDELFRGEILRHLHPRATILDLGAGAGLVRQMDFKGRAGKVCGVDPDEAVLRNPHLDEARAAGGEDIPYPDETFDLVFADNVLEHLPEPERVFAEVARVLVPGGLFLAKTPNALHYVPLIARCTPHWFHQWLNRLRGRDEADTFPTLYRANSKRRVERLAVAAGLGVRSLTLHEGRPEYLRMSAASYLLGLAYERAVNRLAVLAPLRVLLVAVLEKPRPAGTGEPPPGLVGV